MPAYAFRCDECGTDVTLPFAIDERPDTVDGPCGHRVRHVIRWGGTTVLRGKGWAKHPERDRSTFKRGPQ